MSGTARSPRYECSYCHDSGLVSAVSPTLGDHFVPCPSCDGKSRLCGEIDEPAPEALPCNCGFSICCTCKAKVSR